jgi:hypothetical protein
VKGFLGLLDITCKTAGDDWLQVRVAAQPSQSDDGAEIGLALVQSPPGAVELARLNWRGVSVALMLNQRVFADPRAGWAPGRHPLGERDQLWHRSGR